MRSLFVKRGRDDTRVTGFTKGDLIARAPGPISSINGSPFRVHGCLSQATSVGGLLYISDLISEWEKPAKTTKTKTTKATKAAKAEVVEEKAQEEKPSKKCGTKKCAAKATEEKVAEPTEEKPKRKCVRKKK